MLPEFLHLLTTLRQCAGAELARKSLLFWPESRFMKGFSENSSSQVKLLSSLLHHRLIPLICVLLTVQALLFLVRAAHIVLYPFEWSSMDGYFVYYGMRLVSGEPIYGPYELARMPFNYVPVYAAIAGFLANIFGSGVWYERAFSLICTMGIAALIFRAVSSSRSNRAAAFIAMLMLFAPAAISVWFIIRGIDSLSTFLSLLGILMVSADERRWKIMVPLGTGVLILAFFTKQTMLFPAIAAIIYVFSRKPRWGIAMGAVYGISVAVFALALEFLSGGWFIENTFVVHLITPSVPGQLLHRLTDFGVILFAAFPVACMQAFQGIRRRPDVWTLYFFSTLVIAMLAGKYGAAISYFIPLLTAVCINVGMWIGDLRLREHHSRLYTCTVLLILAQSISFFADGIVLPTGEDRAQANRLDADVKMRPGPILIERIDSFAVLNGRDLIVEPVTLPYLVSCGKFDTGPLLESIERKEYSLIVYSGDYFDAVPKLRTAVFNNYVTIDTLCIGLFYGGKISVTVLVPS
jgi:hypothetical protein